MMEKTLTKKMSVTMKQESKEVQIDWALIQKYLVDMNLNGKDTQEKTSKLQTQQQYKVSETATRAAISTAQEENLLQNELPPQEHPAELPVNIQTSLEESTSP